MTVVCQEKTTSSEVKKLRAEVEILQSFVIGMVGRDEEGTYRPEFVSRIRKIAQNPTVASFENAGQFNKLISTNE